jgi:4-amino-4-deoxy-L-arabinose transferase-like glycosyltransferase
MVKQSVLLMGNFFTSERFGRPQILAGMLLLVFLAECGWLIAHEFPAAVSAEEYSRVQEGLAQWHGKFVAGTPVGPEEASAAIRMRGNAYDSEHSPLWYLIDSVPLAAFRVNLDSRLGLWLSRLPYALIGALLGASLWYVSRRLYGNAGGYIALSLYCFSPAVLRSSALWFSQPHIVGAWGTFGAVFTAIAVSHTLYAPREVVLWNWRRILLLGVSLAVAVGSQFSLAIVLPLLLIFMFYLAPDRKASALTIFTAALGVAIGLIFAGYFFHTSQFWRGITNAIFLDASGHALKMPDAYLQLGKEILAAGPVLLLLIPAALATYLVWPRSRYFGNTAPLIFACLFAILRVASPHAPESVFTLLAVIFLFVFVAGIAADLLETKGRELSLALIVGLVAANAVWNLIGLARLGR